MPSPALPFQLFLSPLEPASSLQGNHTSGGQLRHVAIEIRLLLVIMPCLEFPPWPSVIPLCSWFASYLFSCSLNLCSIVLSSLICFWNSNLSLNVIFLLCIFSLVSSTPPRLCKWVPHLYPVTAPAALLILRHMRSRHLSLNTFKCCLSNLVPFPNSLHSYGHHLLNCLNQKADSSLTPSHSSLYTIPLILLSTHISYLLLSLHCPLIKIIWAPIIVRHCFLPIMCHINHMHMKEWAQLASTLHNGSDWGTEKLYDLPQVTRQRNAKPGFQSSFWLQGTTHCLLSLLPQMTKITS